MGLSGAMTFDPEDVAKSSVEATIPSATVDTGVAPRDNDLKSARFFDAEKFPTMTFKSTSVRKAGDHYDVAGELTLHGVTKPVVLKLEEPGVRQRQAWMARACTAGLRQRRRSTGRTSGWRSTAC